MPTQTAEPAQTEQQTVSQTVTLLEVVGDLEPLTYLTHAGDGTGRLYLVGKRGRVLVLEGGAVRSQPFLDITDRVGSSASEQGLLSIAFSPQYSSDNTFFVDYTDKQGDTVISRFTAASDTAIADPNSESIILTIDQPYPNHNGGQLQFGPDGMLYIGTGDGGSGGDPQNNGQNVNSLLGKILRIDVSQAGQPYTVPASNPQLSALCAHLCLSVIDPSPRATRNFRGRRSQRGASVIDPSPRATRNSSYRTHNRLCSVIDPSPRATRNTTLHSSARGRSVIDPSPRATRNTRGPISASCVSVIDPSPRATRNSGGNVPRNGSSVIDPSPRATRNCVSLYGERVSSVIDPSPRATRNPRWTRPARPTV